MPVFAAGHIPTAAEWELITDQIDSLTAPGYTSYAGTFVWTSTGTAVAIGTSAVVAVHRRPANSDKVWVGFRITFAGATFGTGDYRFSMPFAASSTALSVATGAASLIDTGTTTRPGTVRFATSTTVLIDSTTGTVGQNSPHVWANTDIIIGAIEYEPA